MLKMILIIFSIFISLSVMAGNDKGNGGDAIVCRNPSFMGGIKSAELLDYYEAREFRSFELKTKTDLSIREKVLGYTRKLAELTNYGIFSDIQIEAYKLILASENFERGILNSPGVKFTHGVLIDIPDSSSLSVPYGCNIEQLAIRISKKFEDDPEYLIQADIFEKLDKDQRAGLILHEIIYRAFVIKLKHQDSVTARYFHQLLMQTDADELDTSLLYSYFEKAGVRQ